MVTDCASQTKTYAATHREVDSIREDIPLSFMVMSCPKTFCDMRRSTSLRNSVSNLPSHPQPRHSIGVEALFRPASPWLSVLSASLPKQHPLTRTASSVISAKSRGSACRRPSAQTFSKRVTQQLAHEAVPSLSALPQNKLCKTLRCSATGRNNVLSLDLGHFRFQRLRLRSEEEQL